MKSIFCTLFIFITSIILFQDVRAQGCVAVRNYSCTAPMSMDSVQSNKWQISLGYRYLKSDRHFRGSHEETERQAEHSEVINKTHSLDISLTYLINKRWSVSATLPLTHSARSSLYEHGFDSDGDGERDRFSTHAYGIGDLRLTGYYRILDPVKYSNRNIIVGLGLKFPTGQDGATDVFYRKDGPDERVADQSIQPGDGGWGFNVEVQAYAEIVKGFGAYINGFYLFNPMETNNVDRGRGEDYERYFSVPDQFLGRVGFYYSIPKAGLSINAGMRVEGVPVKDALGKDEGYRRPGHTISIEPGMQFHRNGNSIELNVPVALYRNRPQSVADQIKTDQTGTFRNGDAAFADYLLLITYARTFGKKSY